MEKKLRTLHKLWISRSVYVGNHDPPVEIEWFGAQAHM